MKFEIRRTSQWWDDEAAPCGGCVREENDEGTTVWTRNFNTLEDLIAFMNEVDCKIIVTENWIEIYDDYRE